MTDDLSYFRRRAAQEAVSARDAIDPRAASSHRALSSAYLRRVSELGEPQKLVQVAAVG